MAESVFSPCGMDVIILACNLLRICVWKLLESPFDLKFPVQTKALMHLMKKIFA